MSMTRDTSHSSIGPLGPCKQLPVGDSLMHVSTALLSCTLDCGENTRVGVGGAVGLNSNYIKEKIERELRL